MNILPAAAWPLIALAALAALAAVVAHLQARLEDGAASIEDYE